jgi:hypothetical protein
MKKIIKYGCYALLSIGLACYWGYGTYSFATNLKQDIKDKKELKELEKEKLRLEIKKLKIQNYR